MEKSFITLLNELVDYNGKKILEQPDRFLGTFLDFTQNEYRAEAQAFSQFLASKQAKEIKASDDVDVAFLGAIAERFHQASLIDTRYCELIVNTYAKILGLNEKKPEPKPETVEKPAEILVEIPEEKVANALETRSETGVTSVVKRKKILLGAGIVVLFLAVIFFAVLFIGKKRQPIPDGLEFEIVNGSSVTITKYNGTASKVDIPKMIQGLPVTVIGRDAFYGCDSLISVSIPSSVTDINGYAFQNCSSLTSISIPSSVTTIGDRVFQYCDSLAGISVDSNNSVYSSVDGILFDKNIRTIITYPAGKQAGSYTIPSSLTAIGDFAFSGCYILTSITIPSSVIAIGDGAFQDFYSLTNLIIPYSVTLIGEWLFQGCDSLASITVDSNNPAYASIDGVLFDKNIQTIIAYPAMKQARTYTIPSTVTTIGGGAFYNCSSLTSISIPSSVTSIGGSAFSGCNSLTSVTIPSSVTYIGIYMFSNCNSLTSVSIPSSVTAIRMSAFQNCNSLTSISIPSTVTSIAERAFSGCSSLTSVTLSNRTQVENYAFPDYVQITYRN